MLLFLFLIPFAYCWYIALPEILYILYTFFRDIDYNGVMSELAFILLTVYFVAFPFNPNTVMGVTAALIAVDFIWHKTHKPADTGCYYPYYESSEEEEGSGYNTCPYCGSGDTDGSHCYSCHKNF